MSIDWRTILDAFTSYWSSLPWEKQLLHTFAGLLLAMFAVLFWTPLGSRRLAVKCLALAVMLHCLAWAFVEQYDFQSNLSLTPEPELRMALRSPAQNEPKPSSQLTALSDPRDQSRPEPTETPTLEREPEKPKVQERTPPKIEEVQPVRPTTELAKIEPVLPQSEPLAPKPDVSLERQQPAEPKRIDARADKSSSELPIENRDKQARSELPASRSLDMPAPTEALLPKTPAPIELALAGPNMSRPDTARDSSQVDPAAAPTISPSRSMSPSPSRLEESTLDQRQVASASDVRREMARSESFEPERLQPQESPETPLLPGAALRPGRSANPSRLETSAPASAPSPQRSSTSPTRPSTRPEESVASKRAISPGGVPRREVARSSRTAQDTPSVSIARTGAPALEDMRADLTRDAAPRRSGATGGQGESNSPTIAPPTAAPGRSSGPPSSAPAGAAMENFEDAGSLRRSTTPGSGSPQRSSVLGDAADDEAPLPRPTGRIGRGGSGEALPGSAAGLPSAPAIDGAIARRGSTTGPSSGGRSTTIAAATAPTIPSRGDGAMGPGSERVGRSSGGGDSPVRRPGFGLDEGGTVDRGSPGKSDVAVRRRMTAGDDVDPAEEVRRLLAKGRSSTGNLVEEAMGDQPASLWRSRTAPDRLQIVLRHGGSIRTEQAVADALEWLAAHQSKEGHWDSDDFSRQCPDGDKCSGPAIEVSSDTGLTGLALLAYLGAGQTHLNSEKHSATVRRGLGWLLENQQPSGDLRGEGRIYSHAMATLALTEAYAMSKDEQLRDPAQRAIDWLVSAQHQQSGGWRYGPGQFGDTSVYGWVVLSLKSARSAGLRVPERTWTLTQRWLPLVSSGPHLALAAYQPGTEPSHAMTAEAMVCRQIFGIPRTDPALNAAGDYLLTRLPDVNDYHLYYWYYGTLSMFQLGGSYWKRWNERLTTTLLDTQEKTGHAKGSWPPRRPFGIDGGRIFETATSALCLEVYYRYLPMYSTSGNTAADR